MNAPRNPPRTPSKLSPRAAAAIIAALILYVLLRPWLQAQLGVVLPSLLPEQPAVVGDAPPAGHPSRPSPADKTPSPQRPTARDRMSEGEREDPSSVSPGSAAPTQPTPQHEIDPAPQRPKPSPQTVPSTRPRPSAESTAEAAPPPEKRNASPELGHLTDLGGRRLRSTAGLIYEPLRSEHRVDHVLRHAKDDTSRPVHGVFSGDRAEILAVIDEAWLLAQKGRSPQVEREEEGDRTVLIIDLGRKIGFMGGQAGQRKGHPACRHLQLVVEGNEVVTAYPVLPR